MNSTGKFCKQIKRNGQPCTAYAGAGSEYCFWHDPARAAQRAAAHSAGGKARHGRTLGTSGAGERVKLESVADVLKLLEREVNSVLTLEVSLSRGQTIARLAGAFVSAFQVGELEQRIVALENRMRGENESQAPD